MFWNFSSQNQDISIGICMIVNFTKDFPFSFFTSGLSWSCEFSTLTNTKLLDFKVICELFFIHCYTIENVNFASKTAKISNFQNLIRTHKLLTESVTHWITELTYDSLTDWCLYDNILLKTHITGMHFVVVGILNTSCAIEVIVVCQINNNLNK